MSRVCDICEKKIDMIYSEYEPCMVRIGEREKFEICPACTVKVNDLIRSLKNESN